MSLRAFARLNHLFVRRVGIAPAEIFLYRARKQHVLLQHDRNLIAQAFEVVVPDVYSADEHLALRHVVKTGDEVDERSLARPRAAEYAHRLPGLYFDVDVAQSEPLRLFGVLETHVPELHAAVGHFIDGVVGVGQRALLVKHLRDTLGRRRRDGNHDHDHRQHHQRGHTLRAVRDEAGQRRGVQLRCAGIDDELRTVNAHERNRRPYGELHKRAVERHYHFAALEVRAHVLRRLCEFLYLVIFADIGLHDAHALDVFLNGLVHRVVLLEHLRENGVNLSENEEKPDAQHGNEREEYERYLPVDGECHNDGHDEHNGASHRDADYHHKRVLNVGDVRRHARDQT